MLYKILRSSDNRQSYGRVNRKSLLSGKWGEVRQVDDTAVAPSRLSVRGHACYVQPPKAVAAHSAFVLNITCRTWPHFPGVTLTPAKEAQ